MQRNIEFDTTFSGDYLRVSIHADGLCIETEPRTFGDDAQDGSRVALSREQWDLITAEVRRFDRLTTLINQPEDAPHLLAAE